MSQSIRVAAMEASSGRFYWRCSLHRPAQIAPSEHAAQGRTAWLKGMPRMHLRICSTPRRGETASSFLLKVMGERVTEILRAIAARQAAPQHVGAALELQFPPAEAPQIANTQAATMVPVVTSPAIVQPAAD